MESIFIILWLKCLANDKNDVLGRVLDHIKNEEIRAKVVDLIETRQFLW